MKFTLEMFYSPAALAAWAGINAAKLLIYGVFLFNEAVTEVVQWLRRAPRQIHQRPGQK